MLNDGKKYLSLSPEVTHVEVAPVTVAGCVSINTIYNIFFFFIIGSDVVWLLLLIINYP